jgi:hypothetical protein
MVGADLSGAWRAFLEGTAFYKNEKVRESERKRKKKHI